MEWERLRWRAHLERMQHDPHVPHRISSHELRIHSREPCYQGICDHNLDACLRLIFLSRSVVASLPFPGSSRRHRIINVILSRHIIDPCVFRPSPWVCDGHCHGRVRRRWTGFRSCHRVIASAFWSTCDAAYSWGVELCGLCCYFLCYSAPSGVQTDTAVSCTRQEGSIHCAGPYIPRAYISTPAHTQDPQLLASFFQAAGNIIPLYYLTTYSTYVLGFSPTTASMLLAVNNGVNSVSRVAMGFIADHAGRQNTLVGCVRSDLCLFA